MTFNYPLFERCFHTALTGIALKQQIANPANYQAAVTNAMDVALVAEERLRPYYDKHLASAFTPEAVAAGVDGTQRKEKTR